MKKLVSKLLCGVMLSSVILCGCNQATEPTATAASETESQTEATTTTAPDCLAARMGAVYFIISMTEKTFIM